MLRERERTLSQRPAAAGASRARISASAAAACRRWSARSARFDVCATADVRQLRPEHGHGQGRRPACGDLSRRRCAGGGYTQTDLDEVGALFDAHLYPIDTTAFGRESDLDGNGVVIVLLSQHVNDLSPTATTTRSIILGFFFGAGPAAGSGHGALERRRDLLWRRAAPGHAELLGVPKRCRHAVAARRVHPRVPAHDQLQPACAGARRPRPRRPGSTRGSPTSPRSWAAARCPTVLPGVHQLRDQFIGGDIANAYGYLDDPEDDFLVRARPLAGDPRRSAGPPGCSSAGWPITSRPPSRWRTELTRGLVLTNLIGAANVEAVTGRGLPHARLPMAAGELPDESARLHAVERPAALHQLRPAGDLRCQLPRRVRQALSADARQHQDGSYDRTGVLRGGIGAPRAHHSARRIRRGRVHPHRRRRIDRAARALPRPESRSCGCGEAHDLPGRRRRAVCRVRHRLPGQRRRPLPDARRHRGDPDPPGPPADRGARRRPAHRAGPPRCARPRGREPRLRRRPGPRGQGDLHHLRRRRPRHAAPGAAGGAARLHLPAHLEVSHRRPDPLQGLLRPQGRPARGRPAGRRAATTSTCAPRRRSRRWAGSTTRCSRPRSPATRWSWRPPCSTRSRTTRCT